jgi:hypothetical protein
MKRVGEVNVVDIYGTMKSVEVTLRRGMVLKAE